MDGERILACLCVAAVYFGSFSGASAEGVYSTGPIRLIVPYPPGGGSDAVVRSIQPFVERQLGQSLVIDNRSAPAASSAST